MAALASIGLDVNLAPTLSAEFGRERRADWAVDPAATRTLDALEGRYRLALVTNGAPDVQREKLEGSGLARHFATVVISGALGVGKPEPGIFSAALDGLRVDARDAIVVGDSVERDISGARTAGLRSIWLDRDRTGAAAPADVRITSLDELPAALETLVEAIPAARSA